MNPKPTVGRVVHFYLNEDMAVSPAVVINTEDSAKEELYNLHHPEAPAGSCGWDGDEDLEVSDAFFEDFAGRGLFTPAEDRIDLLVHGLVRDYRAYYIPHSTEPRAGHWSWPPRV